MDFQCDGMEARVGIEPSIAQQKRKLLVSGSDRTSKNRTNAEVGYTAGTRALRAIRRSRSWITTQSRGRFAQSTRAGDDRREFSAAGKAPC
jgi:hypothetical protein